jgi:NAD-dependent DNA ligase
LPLDQPLPDEVVFSGNEFVPTGRFAFGTRSKVADAITALNGIPKDGFPTQTTRYLIIGVFASRDWYHTNYGRKIERAVELRSEGHPISILSEEHWRSFIP